MDVSIYIYVFACDWLSLNSTNCMLQLTIVRIDGRFHGASDGAAHTTRVSPLFVKPCIHLSHTFVGLFLSASVTEESGIIVFGLSLKHTPHICKIFKY